MRDFSYSFTILIYSTNTTLNLLSVVLFTWINKYPLYASGTSVILVAQIKKFPLDPSGILTSNTLLVALNTLDVVDLVALNILDVVVLVALNTLDVVLSAALNTLYDGFGCLNMVTLVASTNAWKL